MSWTPEPGESLFELTLALLAHLKDEWGAVVTEVDLTDSGHGTITVEIPVSPTGTGARV
ncbi:MAG: hypothetical protein M3Q23_00565 [Actinomycetota bacterium]|nr:hypothetical protein [Actinomycetota bacterium]